MTTLCVAIPAYNAEKNIARLLGEVLTQREQGFVIKEVLVHVDLGADHTAVATQAVTDPRLRVIEATERQGFAGSFKRLLRESSAEIFVQLNDDVVIDDSSFLGRFIAPFLADPRIGLSFAQVIPLSPENFVERVADVNWQTMNNMKLSIRGGRSVFTVDGKGMALSRKFMNALQLDCYEVLGNVDTTLYFECLLRGFLYNFTPRAAVRFRHPSNWPDYRAWNARNASERGLVESTFGSWIQREYRKPKFLYARSLLAAAWRDLPAALFFLIESYLTYLQTNSRLVSADVWPSLASTKQLTV